MSELKEHLFCECDEFVSEYRGQSSNEMRPYYLKSDADKVIAELKADYQEACDRLQTANLIKDEQLAETRHQKWKRCLAMAKWCDAKADWYYGIGESLRNRVEFYIKWHKRWLELAEQFKEGI